MRFLLDTVAVSEPARPVPDAAVLAWLSAQSPLDLAVSVLTLGELQRGVDRMPAGRRRSALEAWLASDLPPQFGDRVLPVDEAVALAWGRLTAAAERAGRPLHAVDGLLLATAQAHRLTVVTRNVRDFEGRGVPVLCPWEGV